MPPQHPSSILNPPSSPPSSSPWPALESSRGLSSVPACWRERLGEHYDAFRSAFLTQSSQPAKYYPCPKRCGCMHEIVETSNFKLQTPSAFVKSTTAGKEKLQAASSNETSSALEFGVWSLKFSNRSSPLLAVCRCPEPHCPDIPLSPADAVLLELSWTKLARAICRAFHLDSRPLDLGLLNTRQIGSWSAAAVPVILTIQTDHAWFRGHILELISRLRSRFILLAPTSAHFDAIAQDLIESANAGFFPLEGNLLLLPSGLLQPTKTPGKLFARFNPDPKSEPGEDIARHAFALVEQLETSGKPPSPLSVFRLYCMEGLSANKIARKLRCSKPTVLRRLKLIQQRIGVAPEKLRRYSGHLEEMETSDHRARRIHQKALIEED